MTLATDLGWLRARVRVRRRSDAPRRVLAASLAPALCLAAIGLSVRASAAATVPAALSELSRRLASNRSAANFRALQSYADGTDGANRDLALHAIGMARYDARDYPAAESAFAAISGRVAWRREYAAYYRARCIVLAEDFARALGPLERFLAEFPGSRFVPAATRLRVESFLRLRRRDEARAVLASLGGRLDAPVRLYLAGRVEHLDGNLLKAVKLYREAYYFHPFSDQAEASSSLLDSLRARMGGAYPSAPADWRLARAEALLAGRSYARASAEFARALAGGLAGGERDRAVILRGHSDYSRGSDAAAYSALAKARPGDPELEARRLYLLAALERRRRLVRPMLSSLSKLALRHGSSPWYQEALLSIGNFYYLRDDRTEYPRMFRRLVEAFPDGRHAPYAHWKLCWRAWLDRSAERWDLLAEHVRRYPGSATASAALYWLGRLRQLEGRATDASSYFHAVARSFPHYYYGGLARKRLGGSAGRPPETQLSRELAEMVPAARQLASEPRPATRNIVDVSTVLYLIGRDSDARRELERVDYRQADAHFAGLGLGRIHAGRGRHYLGVRAVKRYAFGYLRFPLEALDAEYWRYLYPLGWEDELRARAGRHRLDPYLVAGLIRQESEFDPAAKSRAGALGLMQIMPGTGRGLFRRLGIPGFSTRKLTIPDVSLRLGTFHLKQVLDQFGGQAEKALAAYNAGNSRVAQWMQFGPYRDLEEFVETIPFSETRGYVQAVLRNRAAYARIYGE